MTDGRLISIEQLTPLLELETWGADKLAELFSAILNTHSSDTTSGVQPGAVGSTSEQQRLNMAAVFSEASRLGLTADQLEARLRSEGLGNATATAAALAWVQQSAARGVLAAATLYPHRLLDVEWTFGVTASSSELESVGSTYVQLRLLIGKESQLPEYAHFELSLPKFYDFLHELERAKAHLDLS
mmetsp:Transcript_44833/g.74415  ORF Transcript_44833/g.74415 Transcript_44833/m.74415 type:complete len:186 (-) Transcript_44833:261-818(-)|eukprot:CAMPEP_0119316070 /NCGR_PEP_ID=MMETSP1333-20130426/38403_1 /TAXON_ID=418940 /ORGANISM="Scyphosphaera apsteinii, Strain RCC1455" /LENGTH=185 /DNA_ID=CAMNT_0007321615 /DNA_START=20 /DNA_END=577 /DNA_ORIENTATION=-